MKRSLSQTVLKLRSVRTSTLPSDYRPFTTAGYQRYWKAQQQLVVNNDFNELVMKLDNDTTALKVPVKVNEALVRSGTFKEQLEGYLRQDIAKMMNSFEFDDIRKTFKLVQLLRVVDKSDIAKRSKNFRDFMASSAVLPGFSKDETVFIGCLATHRTAYLMNWLLKKHVLSLETDALLKVDRALKVLRIEAKLDCLNFVERGNRIELKVVRQVLDLVTEAKCEELFYEEASRIQSTILTTASTRIFNDNSDSDHFRSELFYNRNPAIRDVDDLMDFPKLRNEYLELHTFKQISDHLYRFIKEKNEDQAEFFLELLIEKLELLKSVSTIKDLNYYEYRYHRMLLHFGMTFKGYQSVSKLLEVINSNERLNKYPMRFMQIVLGGLRRNENDVEFLTLLNKIIKQSGTELLTNSVLKDYLAVELFIFLRKRYVNNPKVLLGHFMSIYPGHTKLLNELGLISVCYEGVVGEMEDLSGVFKADVNPMLAADTCPPIHILTEIYIAVLEYLSVNPSLEVYGQLFETFVQKISEIQKSGENHRFYSQLDMFIPAAFINRVCSDFNKSPESEQLAIKMATSSITNLHFLKKDSVFIQQILYIYRNMDKQHEQELMPLMDGIGRKIPFRLICVTILKLVAANKPEEAKIWYDLLVEMNIPIRHFELNRVIDQQGWKRSAKFDEEVLKQPELSKEAVEEMKLLKGEKEEPGEVEEQDLGSLLEQVGFIMKEKPAPTTTNV